MSDKLADLAYSVENLAFVPENGHLNGLVQVFSNLMDFLAASGKPQAAIAADRFLGSLRSRHLDATVVPLYPDDDLDDDYLDDDDLEGATVTVRGTHQDLTIHAKRSWEITTALDERGHVVVLSESERAEAQKLLNGGVDETGR